MTYHTTLEAAPRGQFDSTSGSCASFNCGPTDAAFVDGFYHDRKLSIAYVRGLAYTTCNSTSASGVETMLDKLGISSDHHYGTTIDLIKQVVWQRTRPIIFTVRMGYIPYSYSRDSFTGNHWLVGCANSKDAYGQTGVIVMDSNAPSSTGGFHFIPDWALSRALLGDAVIPRYSKLAPICKAITRTSKYTALRRAVIPAGAVVYGYNAAYPGRVMVKFGPDPNGSSFRVSGKQTVSWPAGCPSVVPTGTFLVGYDGAFKGQLVIPSKVKSADGKPW